MKKFATFTTMAAVLVPEGANQIQRAAALQRLGKRWDPSYEVRPGFLYVRSRAISSRTNDNHDEFPADEIAKAYRTFVGKPVFVNHVNDNHRRARGVIIDAALHRDRLSDGSPDTWCEVLMEVDAKNFPKLAKAIVEGRIDRTSMGCDVDYSVCSACGNKATTPAEYCQHIPRLKGKKILKRNAATGAQEEHLIRETCYGLRFFENSLLVEPPADPTALFLGVDTRGIGGKVAVRREDVEVHQPRAEDLAYATMLDGLRHESARHDQSLIQAFAAALDPAQWPKHPQFRPGDRIMERGKWPGTVTRVDEATDAGEHPMVWFHEDDARVGGESGMSQRHLEPHPDASPEQMTYYHAQKAKNDAGEPYVPERERHIDESDRVTVHHLTDKHDFALDPNHRPHNNTTSGGDLSPRLFVGDPEQWAEGEYHYRRPYVAEMSVPRALVEGRSTGYSGEKEIPARHFDKVQVHRVVPYDAYRAERWDNKPFEGDARDWTPEQHRQHLEKHRNYLHDEHNWGWNEFDEHHNHVGLGDEDWDDKMPDPSHGYPGTYVRRDRDGNVMRTVRSSLTEAFAGLHDSEIHGEEEYQRRQNDPSSWQDERGVTTVHPRMVGPEAELPTTQHYRNLEMYPWHPRNLPLGETGQPFEDAADLDAYTDSFTPLRQSLNSLMAHFAAEKPTGPSVSGVVLKAADTGRVLMLQRSLEDADDPARGTWEFPGGHHEDGDTTSLHAGIREWQEEVGQPFPTGGVVSHTWRSPNGIYQGHVVVIPSEDQVTLHQGRVVPNPDDPDGDHAEQAAWWDPEHARKNPALRKEVKSAPWDQVKKAANRLEQVRDAAQEYADRLPRCSGCGQAYQAGDPEGLLHDHWTAKEAAKHHHKAHHHHKHKASHPMYTPGSGWLGGWGMQGFFGGQSGYCCPGTSCAGVDTVEGASAGAGGDAGGDGGAAGDGGATASRRTASERMTLYRGEGTHERPSYYPKTGPDARAGAWWTDSLERAQNYAKSTTDGQVYRIEVGPGEAEPSGMRGNYLIRDPEVRARRVLHTASDFSIPLGEDDREFYRQMRDAGQMRRQMGDPAQSRVVDLTDPTDLRAHMLEAHGYGEDDFWRNSHDADHSALQPGSDTDRPLSHREVRSLHDWEHGHGIANDDPDYDGGMPGQFMGDSHFHTARRTAGLESDLYPDSYTDEHGVQHDVCANCYKPIRETGDYSVPWIHKDSHNSKCDVSEPADAVMLRGVEMPEAEPLSAHSSLRKKADEDQCPYDASDSLMRDGAYVCEEGHRWSPEEPAARRYHGDGPERGRIQPYAARKQAVYLKPGDAIWAKPAGEYPEPGEREYSVENPTGVNPADGPFHLTRHPETRAHQLVDRKNRLIAQSTDTSGPGAEHHAPDWMAESFHEINQRGGHHTPLPYKTDDVVQRGEPERTQIWSEVKRRESGQSGPKPAFEHSTVDPKQVELEGRPKARQAVPEGSQPDDEWHGPYEVVQHPETGKFHVVDNQGRHAAPWPFKKDGHDTQTDAESYRDDIDKRMRSKENARSTVDRMLDGAAKAFGYENHDDAMAQQRSQRYTNTMTDLMHRYEGGEHHPLSPGRFGFDDEEHEGDQLGQPYYAVKDPGGSGFEARDYGGPYLHVHHESTGEVEHDLIDKGGNHGSMLESPTYPEGWDHESVVNAIHRYAHGDEEGYAPGKDMAEHGDPRIKRWQKRKGYQG